MKYTLVAACAALLAVSSGAWAASDASMVNFCGTVTKVIPMKGVIGGKCYVVKVVAPDGTSVEFAGPAGTAKPIKEGTTISGFGHAGGLMGAKCTGDGVPLLGVTKLTWSPPEFLCSMPPAPAQ